MFRKLIGILWISGLFAAEPYDQLHQVLPYYMLGWYSNRDAVIALVTQKGNPSTVIEIGSYLGESTAHFATLLRPGGKVYAVDWWQGLNHILVDPIPGSTYESVLSHTIPRNTDMFHQFLSNMMHLKISDTVIPIRAETQQAPKMLHDLGVFSADLIYIDADHGYTCVLADCNAWYPFVSDGKGILCGDDWGWTRPEMGENYTYGVQRAVTQFAKEHNLTIHTNGWFWWLDIPK